jgi:hypothetical protein
MVQAEQMFSQLTLQQIAVAVAAAVVDKDTTAALAVQALLF